MPNGDGTPGGSFIFPTVFVAADGLQSRPRARRAAPSAAGVGRAELLRERPRVGQQLVRLLEVTRLRIDLLASDPELRPDAFEL